MSGKPLCNHDPQEHEHAMALVTLAMAVEGVRMLYEDGAATVVVVNRPNGAPVELLSTLEQAVRYFQERCPTLMGRP
jgi:hypothetical protein